jgi:hypothetical protein
MYLPNYEAMIIDSFELKKALDWAITTNQLVVDISEPFLKYFIQIPLRIQE